MKKVNSLDQKKKKFVNHRTNIIHDKVKLENLSRSTPASPLGNHKLLTRNMQLTEIQSLPPFTPHRIKLTDRSSPDNKSDNQVTGIVLPPTIQTGSKPTKLKLKRKNASPCLQTSVIRFSQIFSSSPESDRGKEIPDLPYKALSYDRIFDHKFDDDELILKAVIDDEIKIKKNEQITEESTEHMQSLQNEIVQMKLIRNSDNETSNENAESIVIPMEEIKMPVEDILTLHPPLNNNDNDSSMGISSNLQIDSNVPS